MKNRVLEYERQSAGDGKQSEGKAQQFQTQFDESMEWVERFLGDRPLVSIGVGLSLGILIGWLVKR